MRKSRFDRHPSFSLFFQSIRINPGESPNQGSFSMVNVTRCSNYDVFWILIHFDYSNGVEGAGGIEPPPRFLDDANGFAARGVPSTTAPHLSV